MAKRKKYLEEAERAIVRLLIAYSEEHDQIPDFSVLKSALTKSYNKVHSDIHDEIRRSLKIKTTPIQSYWDAIASPEYKDAYKEFMIQVKEQKSVHNIRL